MVAELASVSAPSSQATNASNWRYKLIGLVRIAFGFVWAFAAWLKWQPDFQHSFLDTVGSTKDGQPALAAGWISLWVQLVSTNPLLFARVEASLETALAVALIFGIFSNLTYFVGFFLALGIWSTAEGFGGPYKLGQSTDIGTAFPYALFFLLLFAVQAGRYYGLDRWLAPRLGHLKFLAN